MLSSLFMAAFAAQVADDGFSKLQIFLQQLIDWGRKCRWTYYRSHYHLCGRTVPDFPSSENAGEVIGKKTCGCQYPELREKFSQYLADHSADYCRYRQIWEWKPLLLQLCWHLPVWLSVWHFPETCRILRVD